MSKNDDKKEAKPDKKEPCPICRGTGFANGEICVCITGTKFPNGNDLPDFLMSLFKCAGSGIKDGKLKD